MQEMVVREGGNDLENKDKLQIFQLPPYFGNQIPSECFSLAIIISIFEPVKHELSYSKCFECSGYSTLPVIYSYLT